MKKILFLLGAVFIVSCNSNQKAGTSDSAKSDSSKKTTAATVTDKKTASDDPSTMWDYASDTDKMTSKLTYQATINSTNKLQFESPYDGGSTASILIRNKDGKNDVMLIIDKGQFVSSVSDDAKVNVRFDSDLAIAFTGSEPSDGSSTVLFIDPAKKFITHIKNAKKMIVQAEFYESGLREMEFNVAGLKWDH